MQAKCSINVPCPIAITIYGAMPGTYRITPSTDQTVVQVQDGLPVQGAVYVNQYAYFKYQLLVSWGRISGAQNFEYQPIRSFSTVLSRRTTRTSPLP